MNKKAKIALALVLGVMICGIVALVAARLRYEARIVYATPERRSVFLQSYNPYPIVRKFEIQPGLSQQSAGDTAGAGDGAATYSRLFVNDLTIRSQDRQAVVTALTQDLAVQIRASGASMTTQSTDDAKGFTFEYVQGRGTGKVMVSPPRTLNADEIAPGYLWLLHPGEVPVRIVVSVNEIWRK